MTDQETSLQNAYVDALTAEMGPTALTANVTDLETLTSPCLIVINMESDTLREYILFDGTFGATSFVATHIDKRYQAGSAFPSNITHPIGAPVQSIAAQQHFEDLNDRVDAADAALAALDHADLGALGADDHTDYYNEARGDARYAQVASPRFPLIFSGGKGAAEVTVYVEAFRYKAPFACTLVSGTLTAGVAPTGSTLNGDIHKNTVTMFGTLPFIADGEKDGAKQAPTVTAIAVGDIITGHIAQVGSTTPGENITFILEIEVP